MKCGAQPLTLNLKPKIFGAFQLWLSSSGDIVRIKGLFGGFGVKEGLGFR